MLLDVRLPGISGFEVLRIVKENYSLIEVIMISAINEVETAVQAMKHGAYHYVTKDFDYDQLRSLVAQRERAAGSEPAGADAVGPGRRPDRARVRRRPEQGDARHRRSRPEGREAVGHGADPRRERHRQGTAGAADSPRGRRRRRRRSSRSTWRRFPRELAESALFGHERGAFTGAHRQQLGKFELAVERDAVPRRDRRPAARPAGEAAARDSGRRDRAGRRHQADQDRVPADRGDERRPREGGEGGTLPRRPLLPDQRHPHQAAAAARADRGHPAARRVLPAPLQRAVPEERSRASPIRRWRC